MLDFGTVYWKPGIKSNASPEEHFLVVLNVDDAEMKVWYQTFTSQIKQVFLFSNGKPPYIDVDAVAFLNYQKYSYLDKDTCVMMWYGVTKENKSVFEQNVINGIYKPRGNILNINKASVLLSLKSAVDSYKLTENERQKILAHYALTK